MKGNNPKKLGSNFKKLEQMFINSYVILFLVSTFVITRAMIPIQNWFLKNRKEEFVYVAGISVWPFVLCGLFISLVYCSFIMNFIMNVIGRKAASTAEEWNLFKHDLSKRLAYGRDIKDNKVNLFGVIFILLPSIIMLFLSLYSYVIVTPDRIYQHSMFSLKEKSYSFKDVTKIIHIAKFKNRITGLVEPMDSSYKIVMNDGYKIDTLDLNINKKPIEVEIANYISKKSNVLIKEGIHNVDD